MNVRTVPVVGSNVDALEDITNSTRTNASALPFLYIYVFSLFNEIKS